MLHLWPRISALQEEQHFLGTVEGDPATIGRTSAFTTILPNPIVGDDANAYRPFAVLQPHPHNYPPPFFVERELSDIFKLLGEPSANIGGGANHLKNLLYGERLGVELFRRADGGRPWPQTLPSQTAIPYVLPIPFESLGIKPTDPPTVTPGQRLDRREMFACGLSWSNVLAHALFRYVIDPTRLDQLNPDQPFVQTNLYVVASLAEPLSSALIWPLLAELKETLSTSNLVRVVGIFATGSFAPDATRSIEEAACYAALCELEALQGVPSKEGSTNDLRAVVGRMMSNRPSWTDRVGMPLFDHIYLLDREKSNQSLARDSLEMTVLAANALEAFLTVQGDTYIDQNLVYRTPASLLGTYSLLGSASNYVPLGAYLQAALDEEKKRLARELILEESPQEKQVDKSLIALGATPEGVVRDLLEPRTIRVFSRISKPPAGRTRRRVLRILPWTRKRATFTSEVDDDWLPDLFIRRAYIFPPSVEAQMQEPKTAWRWRAVTESQADTAIRDIEKGLKTTYLENVWGLFYNTPEVEEGNVEATLADYHTRTWAERRIDDPRTLPHAVYLALQQSVADISSGPGGLRLARARVKAWLDETNRLLRTKRVTDHAQVEQWAEQDRDDYRAWQRKFVRVAGGPPHAAASGVRAVLFGLFLSFVAVVWLLSQTTAVDPYVYLLTGVVLTSIMVLVGLTPHMIWLYQIQRVKTRRIALALRRAEHIANKLLRETLLELYRQLRDHLKAMHNQLDATVEDLEKWAQPRDPVPIPPSEAIATHLHTPFIDTRLWEQAKERLRNHPAPKGANNSEYLTSSWQGRGANMRQWQMQGASMAQVVRLLLEKPLSKYELATVRNLEARKRAASAPTPGQAQQQVEDALKDVLKEQADNNWCGFAVGSPSATPRPECTACPNIKHMKCLFSRKDASEKDEWSLSTYVRGTIDSVLEYLLPKGRVLPNDRNLIRTLLRDYALEKLLFDPRAGTAKPSPLHENGRVHSASNGHNGTAGMDRAARKAYVGRMAQRVQPPSQPGAGAHSADAGAPGGLGSVQDPERYLESLLMRAKPAAGHDDVLVVDRHLETVSFGTTEEGNLSALNQASVRLKLELLASQDPLSITVVTTLNRLALENLTLTEQYMRENLRLHATQRRQLFLLTDDAEIEKLYGDPGGVLQYEEIVF
jgi:hypothetical protein